MTPTEGEAAGQEGALLWFHSCLCDLQATELLDVPVPKEFSYVHWEE